MAPTSGLLRTKSDSSYEILSKEAKTTDLSSKLPTLPEVELAKCECCGMSEECTPEYIDEMRGKFAGRLICGLCAEAVKEEMGKNGGRRDKALEEHMSACVRFNRIGRAYPCLYQAEAMRDLLRKSCRIGANKSFPRDQKGISSSKGGIARSSSCIPAITEEIRDKLRVI